MTHEIECTRCSGEGNIYNSLFREMVGCPDCFTLGWRAMTADEEADAAEAQEQERIHGEPPVNMAEQHRAAWAQKQDLRS